MRALPVAAATIDGEGLGVDDHGVTDFERLRSALAERGGSRAVFLYGFDLLTMDGEDLRSHDGLLLSDQHDLFSAGYSSAWWRRASRPDWWRRGVCGGCQPDRG